MRPLALLALALLPALAGAQSARVTLDEALAIARDQSVMVLRARADIARAQASVRVAGAERWPTLSFGAGGGQGYGLALDPTIGQLTNTTTESIDVGVSASYTVYDGGARSADLRAAETGLRAAELDRDRAALEATATVVEGFQAIAQAEAARAVAVEALEAERQLLAVVETQVEVGERAESEIAQQRERVAATRGDVLAAERDEALAEARLVRTLGLDPTGEYAFPVPDPAPLPTPEPAGVLVERALGSRADVRAARAAVRAAEAERGAARAGTRPRVAVLGSAGTQYSSAGEVALTDQLGTNRGGSLRLSVSFPLFDGGRTAARVRQAEARTLAAQVAVEDTRRGVVLDVRERRIQLDAVQAQAEVADVQVAAAQTALDAEQARYLAGAATLQDVSVLRARLVEAQTLQARLAVEAVFARRLLAVAVGA